MKLILLLTIYTIYTNAIGQDRMRLTEHQPEIMYRSNNINWGFSNQQLNISDASNRIWKFEAELYFHPNNIRLINDSQLSLRSKTTLYMHDIQQHKLIGFEPQLPISKFLLSPLEKMNIELIWSGCTNSISYKMEYSINSDSTLMCRSDSGSELFGKTNEFKGKTINSKSLYHILSNIQSVGVRKLQIKDLKLTDSEKKFHLKKIDETQLKNSRKDTAFRAFYISFLDSIENTDSALFESIFYQNESIISQASIETEIELINQSNDTLRILKFCNGGDSMPLNNEWIFSYNNFKFPIYDIELSKFIYDCTDNEILDNSYLFYKIAQHLYYKSKN